MGYSGTLQLFDRLSPTHVLKGSRGSLIGVIGTLMIFSLCLSLYVPAVISYFQGNYYQSQYMREYNSSLSLYSGDDYKIAVVIKNKTTGVPIDHNQLLSLLTVQATSYNIDGYYFENMLSCNASYFAGDINGEQFTDCIVIPDKIQFTTGMISSYGFGYISVYINAPVPANPFYQANSPLSVQQLLYINVLTNCYCEFYFTSTVIAPDNTIKFQVHRIYTSQFDVGSQFISASFQIFSGIRITKMDDSILPWRNLRTITAVNWMGQVSFVELYSNSSALSQGFQAGLLVSNIQEVAVRYYKKIDWLLGVIGGGMFLFYLMFWAVFNYVNRSLLKIELANKLILKNITTENDYPANDQDLQAVNISPFYILKDLLPFCKNTAVNQLIDESEQQNDIVLLLKKIKVAQRNLRKKELGPEFQQKILKLEGGEVVYQESQYNESGSQYPSHMLSNSQAIPLQANREGQSYANIQAPSSHSDPLNQEENISHIEIQSSRPQRNDNIILPPPVMVVQQDRTGQINNIPATSLQNIEYNKQRSQDRQYNNQIEFMQINEMNPVPRQNHEQIIIQPEQIIEPPYINNQNGQMQLVIPNANYNQQIVIIEGGNTYHVRPNQIPMENPAQNTNISPAIAQQQSIMPQNTYNVLHQPAHVIIPPNHPKAQGQGQGQAQIQIDDKFNLTSQQLNFIMSDHEIVPRYYENNHTVLAMRDRKPQNYYNLMTLSTYDKWEGHYKIKKTKCLSSLGNAICKGIRMLDMFSVRVDLIAQPNNSSCVGCCFSLLILVLSILTFYLTCQNMSYLMYKFSYDYIPINNVKFSRVTDNNFNCIVCFKNPSYIQSATRTANFNYFTVINGVTTIISPVQMLAGDNTLNFNNNQLESLSNPIPTSSCYKMPNGTQVNLDQNSYFGYTIMPFCTGTTSYCNSTQNITNSNFVTAIDNTVLFTMLPGSRLNDSTMTLTNDLDVFPYQTSDFIYYNNNLAFEETLEVEQVVLLDDTKFSFMRSAPIVKDTNIAANFDTKRTNFKAVTASSPSYTFKIKPNQSQTTYTVYCNNIDFILGVIGGVFVIWYSIFKIFGLAYNRFHFNSYIAKLIYEQQGHDDCIPNKMLAAINFPDCLVPKFFGWRRDISRMKRVNAKIQRSMHHLSLLKYVDICFRLSSSFFHKIQAKNLSLLYFREKINESDQVEGPVESKPIQVFKQQEFVDFNDEIDNSEMNETNNKIGNQGLDNQKMINKDEMSKLKYDGPPAIIENQSENIIPNEDKSMFLDIFEEPATFSFQKQRQISSVFGGICCLIMIGLVVIVVNYQVGLYLTNGGKTVSYETMIDDSITNPGDVMLLTGTNFRFGLSFINATSLVPFNISSYMGEIGISVILQQFNRTNGIVTPTITVVNLIPCPTGYLQQWLSQTADPTYFANLKFAYCIPNNMTLEISGIPQSQITKSFKVSIYNAMGNSTGFTALNQLLNTSFVQYYFSTPQQNSINRTITYEIDTMIFDYFPITHSVIPVEHNITFCKLNITYKDNAGLQSWIKNPLNQIAYAFDPFSTSQIKYTFSGNPNTETWYNISFSYSKRMEIYSITVPYFYQVFGMIGGVMAIFFAIIGCIARSFNNYRLRYLVGRQLYVFEKLQATLAKQKIKRKAHKTVSDRKALDIINNFSEWDVLKAYFASYWGDFTNNYNFSDTLRRVSLIQTRVQKDMNLAEFYKNLCGVRDALVKELQKDPQVAKKKITNIFLKHINNPLPIGSPSIPPKLLKYAQFHKLSQYEQMVASQALFARVNIKDVFDNRFLQQTFDLADDGSSVHLSNMGMTLGSLGTTSINMSSVASIGEPSENQDP